MTKIEFSESMSVIIEFCTKLFHGYLNLHEDPYSDEGLKRIEYNQFGYDNCAVESFAEEMKTRHYRLYGVRATDIEEDNFVLGLATRKTRRVTLFAKQHGAKHDDVVATFSVSCNYLDGEEISGWTAWEVEKVVVVVDDKAVVLKRHQLNYFDRDATIWISETNKS